MTCDPDAIVLPFDSGFLIKYTREGQAFFSFCNIPKDQVKPAMATAFRVLNDRGDFWRGDIIINGPQEFIDQVTGFGRENSLRLSVVHGAGTQRLIYEEVSGEIAYEAQKNFGRGVANVYAFLCNKDGSPVLDDHGKPRLTNIAVGHRDTIDSKGWPLPNNLLRHFLVDDYGLPFPGSIKDDMVFNMYSGGAPKPMFGVYISDDNDFFLSESKLVNLEDPNQNPSFKGDPLYLHKLQGQIPEVERARAYEAGRQAVDKVLPPGVRDYLQTKSMRDKDRQPETRGDSNDSSTGQPTRRHHMGQSAPDLNDMVIKFDQQVSAEQKELNQKFLDLLSDEARFSLSENVDLAGDISDQIREGSANNGEAILGRINELSMAPRDKFELRTIIQDSIQLASKRKEYKTMLSRMNGIEPAE
jgi:hypothetical protein